MLLHRFSWKASSSGKSYKGLVREGGSLFSPTDVIDELSLLLSVPCLEVSGHQA